MKNLIILLLLIFPFKIYGQDALFAQSENDILYHDIIARNTVKIPTQPLTINPCNTDKPPSFLEKDVIETISIPSYPNFDPTTFFKTSAGKTVEVCYEFEEMMEEYYISFPNEAEEIRNCAGFNLIISKKMAVQNLSPAELFIAISFLSKDRFMVEENSTDIFFISNGNKIYLKTPISRILENKTFYSMYCREENFFFSR